MIIDLLLVISKTQKINKFQLNPINLKKSHLNYPPFYIGLAFTKNETIHTISFYFIMLYISSNYMANSGLRHVRLVPEFI